MSAAQAADLVIEMDTINGELTAGFAALECPAAFVVGTGGHSGAKPEEMATLRAAAASAQAANDRVTVFATAPCNHVQMLTKGADIVTAAIDDLASRIS